MSHPDTARTSSPRRRPCRRSSRNVGVRAAPVPAAELPGGPATASLPTAPSTCRYPRPPPTLPARPSPPRHLRGGLFASRQARAARAGGGEVTAAAGATHPSSPRPGRRADGEIRGSPRRAAGRRRTHTREVRRTCARWPLTLVKNHYSVPVEWVKTCTSSTTSLPSSRLGRASKTASPRRACLPVPELKWAKEEGGSLFHLACGQV